MNVSGESELETVALPDWTLAVKSVKTLQSRGSQNEATGSQSPPSPSANPNLFNEAMAFLLQLYSAFGSSVASEEVRKLVDAFSNKVVQIHTRTESESKESLLPLSHFSCPICFQVVIEPHTARCGHSYCRKCLHKETIANQCRVCSYRFNNVDLVDTRPNVLLMSIADKLWPKNREAASLRNEGNELFKQQKLKEALQKYTQALEIRSTDHLSLCNRAHTFLTLDQRTHALEDAERAIKHCPFWFKSYFRKAASLVCLGRYEDAFCTLTLCIYLIKLTRSPDDNAISLVKTEMAKVLDKIFASITSVSQLCHRRVGEQSSVSPYSPYPDQKRKPSRRERQRPGESQGEGNNGSGDGTESRLKEGQQNGSGLKELSTLHYQKGRLPLPRDLDPMVTRLNHIFSLSLHEVTSFQRLTPATDRAIGATLVSTSDFECSLCYRLLYQSVTTTCGHTYCRSCLERCLDHSPTCPLCKTSLDSCVAYRRHAITYTLELLISKMFPREYADRVNQHLEELADGCASGKSKEVEIPIFVCTMAFPTVPCMLHVFEPRYRLMIRRCMESGSKRFGMCCYLQEGDHNYGDFGTMLEIRNIQYFPDGRSVVNSVGIRRFKVLKKSMKDGYNVGTIEYLEDNKAVEESDRARLRQTHEAVLKDSNEWLQSISPVIHQRIITHFGNMPSPEENWMGAAEGPAWTWWLLAILPLDTKAQLAILSMNNLQKRLDSLRRVLCYVKTRLA